MTTRSPASILRLIKESPKRECLKKKSLDFECSKGVSDNLCPWWINSPKHDNCFWTYINANSDLEGSMSELVQSDLAALFGWSNTKTHFILKKAIDELIQALKIDGFSDLQSLLADFEYYEVASNSHSTDSE